MKAQNDLKVLSELCFGILNAAKDSYLLNEKVAFLKSGQNAAGICNFFLRCKYLKIACLEHCEINSYYAICTKIS